MKYFVVIFILISMLGCGQTTQQCSDPTTSYSGCCDDHNGFNFCNTADINAILFQNSQIVCDDGFVTTDVNCKMN
jgi:hypothetical protein